MKAQIKSMIYGTGLAILAGSALAQTSSDPSHTPGAGTSYQSSSGSSSDLSAQGSQQQFFQAKNFLNEKVRNTQDESLGTIKDIVFNPHTGETFAALDVGNNRYALVPWQALTVTTKGSHGKEQVALNTTKQALQNSPTVPQDQWQELNNRTFVQSIYTHYNVQPPTGMGGTSGTGTGGTGTGTSGSSGTSSSSSQPR
jgi:hypothetical protein